MDGQRRTSFTDVDGEIKKKKRGMDVIRRGLCSEVASAVRGGGASSASAVAAAAAAAAAASRRGSSRNSAGARSGEGVALAYQKFDAKEPDAKSRHDDDHDDDSLGAAPRRPPVVLLHGLMASSGTYRSLLKRADFAPRRDIYAVDLRNHGNSPHHADTSYASMALDVKGFMNNAHIDRACFIGHSFGAKIAMILAMEKPELVSELVVLDIAPVKYDAPPEEDRPTIVALRAMVKVDPSLYSRREDVDAALLTHGVSSPRLRSFLLTNLVPDRERGGRYRWRVNVRAIAAGLAELLSFPEFDASKQFRGRTLFLRGQLSHVLRAEEHGAAIARLFPNARMETIENAGHWLQADAPDRFCEAVNRFLSDR